MKQIKDKPFFTTSELADMLGISVVAVYKRIKAGKIKAEMIGGSYLISREEMGRIFNVGISEKDKEKVKEAVKRTVEEYGNVLKMLGRE